MSATAKPTRRKRKVDLSPAVPAEADISQFHVGWPNTKRVAKLIGYIVLRIPVWWRRPGFHTEPFRATPPKWHLLRARIHSGQKGDWGVLWVAQCGYEYSNDEILGWFLDFRKTAPKKAERCIKCEDAFAEVKRSAGA